MKKNTSRFLLFIIFTNTAVCNGVNSSCSTYINQCSSQYENPLKGIRSFSTLMMYFSEEKETMDAINKIIAEEMGSIATIKMIKPEKGCGQNAFWEGYDGQAFLEFQSEELTSYENQKIPAIRYTLNVDTIATITTTKVNSVVNAWRKDLFIKISDKNRSRNDFEAYRTLIKELKESYLFYNPDKKPIFYLFSNYTPPTNPV